MAAAIVAAMALGVGGCSGVSLTSSFAPATAAVAQIAVPIPIPAPPIPVASAVQSLIRSYSIGGIAYHPMNRDQAATYSETGIASWYGSDFHGRLTANGEIYDMHAITAAHKTLPLPSYVRVTNLENDRSIIVRVNDRGPFKSGRIIDLSYGVANLLGFVDDGLAQVRVDYLGAAMPVTAANPAGSDRNYLLASLTGNTPAPTTMLAGLVPMLRPSPAAPLPAPVLSSTQAIMPRVAGPDAEAGLPDMPASAPADDEADEPAASSPAATGPVVQAGAFRKRDGADRVAAVLASYGEASVATSMSGGAPLHTVRVRLYEGVDPAEAIAAANAAGAGGAYVAG